MFIVINWRVLKQIYSDKSMGNPSRFVIDMCEVMGLYDLLMTIIGSSNSYIDVDKIQEAEELLNKFYPQWMYSSNLLGIK